MPPKKKSTSIDRSALAKQIKNYGTKFAVQELFYNLGMCGKKTVLIPSGASSEEIERALRKFEIESKGVTVRFSFKKALNLPRGFFKKREECLKFILSQRRDYSIIIQKYTKLEHSFELYMSEGLLYLQVMPGIWDVSTNVPPDIVRDLNGEITIWRYAKQRLAKFDNENNEFYLEKRKPFDFETLKDFYKRLRKYQSKLELLRNVFNPLCCHFYEDNKGIFSFLNVRDFGEFPINSDSPIHFHSINGLEDIDKWDGEKPILFNARAKRDNDTPLVMVIKHLADKGVEKVYVNYGILSHPAILLREAGIQVEQSYAFYERKDF